MNDDRPALLRVVSIIEGAATADDMAWLARGFRLWFEGEMPLDMALSLPATPARRRIALRDFWLRQAAAQCSAVLPWRRACELAAAARAFEQSEWLQWRQRSSPPTGAAPLAQTLFYLRRHGGRVPGARRLYDLLAPLPLQGLVVEVAVGSAIASVETTEMCA